MASILIHLKIQASYMVLHWSPRFCKQLRHPIKLWGSGMPESFGKNCDGSKPNVPNPSFRFIAF